MRINSENDVLHRIAAKSYSFSKNQRLIADYILQNNEKAAFMTAGKLSSVTGVSCSTVVRFAKELGYEGYFELQAAVQDIVKTKLTSLQRLELTALRVGNDDILTTVLHQDMQHIKQTLDEIDRHSFNQAVDTIISANKVYIIGARSSSMLSGFLSYYLNIILDNVVLVQATSTSEVFEQILHIGENDTIIAISFPRYSQRTVQSIQYAKKNNAKVVAITDTYSSPLSIIADYTLPAKCEIASFADSLVAPLSIMNALISAVGMKKKDVVERVLTRLEEIWEEYSVYEKTK